jgi:hypothetical protein
MGKPDITWLDQPEPDDYTSAYNYLTLMTTPKIASQLVAALRKAPMDQRMAKDILRASSLPAVDDDNPHVKKHLKELDQGESLHPILLVASTSQLTAPLTIADGYYATSTAYWIDVKTSCPVKLVTHDDGGV